VARPHANEEDLAQLEGVRRLADRHDVAFLVADDPGLADQMTADGVEIDWDPQLYAAARARIGEARSIGCRVGASRHQAMQAAEAGADYVRFLSESSSRDDMDSMIEMCQWWAEIFEVACVAGPVENPEDAAALSRVGVDFVAIDAEAPGTFAAMLAAVEAARTAPPK
jgi:thiamine-phosphate pyrophosphorylase